MGRCNNRRTQEQAQALRNVPSRARFSNPPVFLKKTKKRQSVNNNSTNVVDKMANRLQQQQNHHVISDDAASSGRYKQQRANTAWSIRAYSGNLNDLDRIELSDEIVERVYQVLTEMKVIQRQQHTSSDGIASFESESEGEEADEEEDDADSVDLVESAKQRFGRRNNNLLEYEDDCSYEELNYVEPSRGSYQQQLFDTNWEGTVGSSDIVPSSFPSSSPSDDAESSARHVYDKDDPVYCHLTEHLSFTKTAAASACRALQCWQGATNAASSTRQSSSDWKDRLGLAMDWLALHLNDAELTAGFRHNHNSKNNNYRSFKNTWSPHPSISLATKLTEDTDFLKQARIDELSLGFVQMGFSYTDIVRALEQQQLHDTTGAGDDAIQDVVTLRLLLSKLEEDVLSRVFVEQCAVAEAEGAVAMDRDAILEERQHEIEVLCAVYGADFEVLSQSSFDLTARYKIALSSIGALHQLYGGCTTGSAQETNNASKAAELYVFLRPGYPIVETPLFLFTAASCDVLLLRRINSEILQYVCPLIGSPCIFEVVTFLTENLESIVSEFQKERRAQAFEEQQQIMRKEVDKGLASNVDGYRNGKDDDKIGRRQLARIKGEDRSWDRTERLEQQEEERRQRQQARLQRIKEQDMNIRQVMASEAIERRERERHEESIRALCRSSMLSALNQGATPEEARARSEEEKLLYMKGHGIDTEEVAGEKNVELSLPVERHSTGATPRTVAFMERLRTLYDNAAKHKGLVLLKTSGDVQPNGVRLPCPVATPAGDLAVIIDEVVAIQKEQPWLISSEARVPALAVEESEYVRGTAHINPDGLSKQLKRALEEMHSRRPFASILKQRQRLPAYQMRDDLIRTIANSQVTVVSGETGCGKSLCTPQLVLDDLINRNLGSHANIIVTQPRRISAVGVAERIAFERLESIGETCGYSIKLEKKTSHKTRLLVCTTGILLRRLQCDPDLASVSHVFLDEVHERDSKTDFLLIAIKDLLVRRKTLKLVLMSATLNAESFVNYFPGCATVVIPGRAHPVKEYRLEDVLQHTGYEVPEKSDFVKKPGSDDSSSTRLSKKELRRLYPGYSSKVIQSLAIVDEAVINYQLLALLLLYIVENSKEGAILVFLPGIMEISKALDEIRRIEKFQTSLFRIYPLHSSLTTSEQVAVFEVPPDGVRKIVLSSNIAETSITIEDVIYVVDCGRVKENRRDEVKETPALVECWVSRASAKQRRGRAGRVRPGTAYHMFSSYTYDHALEDHQLPEILRVGLEDLVLQILTLDLGEPCRFLSSAIDPPSALAMKNSLRLLESLGAVDCCWQRADLKEDTNDSDLANSKCDVLDVTTELTALGFHIASLPVDPRVGKMMIFGALFGCVDPAITIAAAMTTSKPLFTSPFEQRDAANEARKSLSVDGSDHLTLLSVFNEWKRLRQARGGRAAQKYATDNFLSRFTLFQMEDLRKHYATLLVASGFLPKDFKLVSTAEGSDLNGANANAGNSSLLRALLCAGLYPNVIVAPRSLVNGSASTDAGECTFQSHNKGAVFLHPCTVSFSAKKMDSRYCCYYEIIRTSKMYVRDLTPISPLAVVLFGGSIETFPRQGVIAVDDWLRFRVLSKQAANADFVPARRVALIKHLRLQMETMMLQKIVLPSDENPGSESKESKRLIDAIVALLSEEQEYLNRDDGIEIVRPYLLPASDGRGRGRQSGRGRQGRGRSNDNRSRIGNRTS